jgi:hypothetical protein
MRKILVKRKKGMSEVVTTVLMIGLLLGLISIVWVVISNLVNKEIKNTETCFGNFDKLTLNEAYTCYNATTKEFYFSLSLGDIVLDNIMIMIGGEGSTSSINLNSTSTGLTNVRNYPSNTSGVTAPISNSGKTYIYSGLNSAPDYIRVAPIIGGEKCQESDSLNVISSCSF